MDSFRTTGCVNCRKRQIEEISAFDYKCVGNCSDVIDSDSLTQEKVDERCSSRGSCCGGPIDGSGCSCKQ